jgi:hypothetical protein
MMSKRAAQTCAALFVWQDAVFISPAMHRGANKHNAISEFPKLLKPESVDLGRRQ